MPAVSRTWVCQEIAHGKVASTVAWAGTRVGTAVTVTAAIVASGSDDEVVPFEFEDSSSLQAGRRATRARARTVFRKGNLPFRGNSGARPSEGPCTVPPTGFP